MNKQIALRMTPSRDTLPNVTACLNHVRLHSRDGSQMAMSDLKRIGVVFPLLQELYDVQCAAVTDKSQKKNLSPLFQAVEESLTKLEKELKESFLQQEAPNSREALILFFCPNTETI